MPVTVTPALAQELMAAFAGAIGTGCFLPQVWKTWRERNAAGGSTIMYIMLCMAFTTWLVFAFMIENTAMIITNIVSLALSLMVLALKVRYTREGL